MRLESLFIAEASWKAVEIKFPPNVGEENVVLDTSK